MSTDSNWKAKYPRNWKKVSRTIRRIAGYRCEKCGCHTDSLSVHHLNIGYINGKPSDKHDVRRENLQSICYSCHDKEEYLWFQNRKRKKRAAKKRERLEKHRALGVGVGLVPYCCTSVS